MVRQAHLRRLDICWARIVSFDLVGQCCSSISHECGCSESEMHDEGEARKSEEFHLHRETRRNGIASPFELSSSSEEGHHRNCKSPRASTLKLQVFPAVRYTANFVIISCQTRLPAVTPKSSLDALVRAVPSLFALLHMRGSVAFLSSIDLHAREVR